MFFSAVYVLCLFACLFIFALWSPAGKWLTFWLSFVMSNCAFVTFPIGILGQVWYLIVLIPDLCTFAYFVVFVFLSKQTTKQKKNNTCVIVSF